MEILSQRETILGQIAKNNVDFHRNLKIASYLGGSRSLSFQIDRFCKRFHRGVLWL